MSFYDRVGVLEREISELVHFFVTTRWELATELMAGTQRRKILRKGAEGGIQRPGRWLVIPEILKERATPLSITLENVEVGSEPAVGQQGCSLFP